MPGVSAGVDDLPPPHPGRQRLTILAAGSACLPAVILRLTTPPLSHIWDAVLFGLAIVGAAFLLSWAAEVAQLDISAGLAIAVLALIAVLPEYAVDFVFAWQGGSSVQQFGAACPATDSGAASPCSLALANMTGANRLLIGLGWTSVVFIAWYRTRRARRALPEGAPARPPRWSGVALDRTHSVELAFLAVATLYSLTLPLKSSITLIDSAVLLTIFVLYSIRLMKAPVEEPHLVGPALWLASFGTAARRVSIAAMAVWAALVIVL